MSGGADNSKGELQSYIIGANSIERKSIFGLSCVNKMHKPAHHRLSAGASVP
ncbi:hypothetical protein EAG21025_31340 [Enterobacter asburiae]